MKIQKLARCGSRHDGPVVFLSVFKSGTHVTRLILERLTGLAMFEPPIVPGQVNYRDPKQLILVDGTFYSWHLVPTPEVQAKLVASAARPVFLLRDPYDLVVSMYHHFAANIDADIGRGRNVQHHFDAIDQAQGLMAIIEGMRRSDFDWQGLGPHLDQMTKMLEFAADYACFVTTYESMMGTKKRQEIVRLADFLDLRIDFERVDAIVRESDFRTMQAKAIDAGHGSHYRNGRSGESQRALEDRHREAVREQVRRHAPRLPELAHRFGLGWDVVNEKP